MLKAYSFTPEIEAIYNDTKVDYDSFDSAYSSAGSSKSSRMGYTKQQDDLFKKISKVYVPKWEAAVVMVFGTDSPEFRSMFPNGRSPLSRGRKDKRIVNIKSFFDVVKQHPELSVLADEVNLVHEKLVDVRSNKHNKEGNVQYSSATLKKAAEKMAIRHFKNAGKLMDIMAEKPEEIIKFFPMKYFRNYHKSKTEEANTYQVNINANSVAEAGINFSLDDNLLITNNSDAVVKYWFSQSKDLSIPANAIILDAEDEVEIAVKNYAGIDDRFLMIANTSANEEAVVEITLLDK